MCFCILTIFTVFFFSFGGSTFKISLAPHNLLPPIFSSAPPSNPLSAPKQSFSKYICKGISKIHPCNLIPVWWGEAWSELGANPIKDLESRGVSFPQNLKTWKTVMEGGGSDSSWMSYAPTHNPVLTHTQFVENFHARVCFPTLIDPQLGLSALVTCAASPAISFCTADIKDALS